VEQGRLARPTVHAAFLKTLATIIPERCRPVLVTDAGFFYHWFEQVTALGWDFSGSFEPVCTSPLVSFGPHLPRPSQLSRPPIPSTAFRFEGIRQV
jgi:hypothetical protein